jgi:hypothetical protein
MSSTDRIAFHLPSFPARNFHQENALIYTRYSSRAPPLCLQDVMSTLSHACLICTSYTMCKGEVPLHKKDAWMCAHQPHPVWPAGAFSQKAKICVFLLLCIDASTSVPLPTSLCAFEPHLGQCTLGVWIPRTLSYKSRGPAKLGRQDVPRYIKQAAYMHVCIRYHSTQ